MPDDKPYDEAIGKGDVAIAHLRASAGWPYVVRAIEAEQDKIVKRLIAGPRRNASIEEMYALAARAEALQTMLDLPDAIEQAAVEERKKLETPGA